MDRKSETMDKVIPISCSTTCILYTHTSFHCSKLPLVCQTLRGKSGQTSQVRNSPGSKPWLPEACDPGHCESLYPNPCSESREAEHSIIRVFTSKPEFWKLIQRTGLVIFNNLQNHNCQIFFYQNDTYSINTCKWIHFATTVVVLFYATAYDISVTYEFILFCKALYQISIS